ncbi:MAG: hypothetical protein KME22_25730 [Hassallia sp. WJT32-NPBG1]|nr:hypothetical protein [Hassallia sp. WJT32-NPBG1]
MGNGQWAMGNGQWAMEFEEGKKEAGYVPPLPLLRFVGETSPTNVP